jgi:hypothetical protein
MLAYLPKYDNRIFVCGFKIFIVGFGKVPKDFDALSE